MKTDIWTGQCQWQDFSFLGEHSIWYFFQISDTWSKHLKKLKILRPTKRRKEIIKYNNLYYVLIFFSPYKIYSITRVKFLKKFDPFLMERIWIKIKIIFCHKFIIIDNQSMIKASHNNDLDICIQIRVINIPVNERARG